MSANRLHRLTTAVRLRGVQVETDAAAGLSALHVRDLSVTSGTLVVVQGESPDEVSTLLLTFAGRAALAGGSLEIAGSPVCRSGTDPVRSPEPWRRRVGFVGPRPVLFGHLSVLGNIALPVRWSGKRHPREEVRKLCRSVGLDLVKDRRPGELGRAEQQRLAIAMAMAYDPDLLVVAVEDPTTEEDALSRTIVDLVRLEGRTIVTSLSAPVVRDAADQVLTLLGGHPIGSSA